MFNQITNLCFYKAAHLQYKAPQVVSAVSKSIKLVKIIQQDKKHYWPIMKVNATSISKA